MQAWSYRLILFSISGARRESAVFGDSRMARYSEDNQEMDWYRRSPSNNVRLDYFSPSIQSLKVAQDIVRRHEKGRRAAANLSHQSRGPTTPPPSSVDAAGGDNILQFRSPVWARPSSRLVYSRHYSPPDPLSHTPCARRASLQRRRRRLSRQARALTASPSGALNTVAFDDVQSDILAHFGVMAIQAMAVVLGLSGLLVLLTVI